MLFVIYQSLPNTVHQCGMGSGISKIVLPQRLQLDVIEAPSRGDALKEAAIKFPAYKLVAVEA